MRSKDVLTDTDTNTDTDKTLFEYASQLANRQKEYHCPERSHLNTFYTLEQHPGSPNRQVL